MRIDTMREIFMRMHEYELRPGRIMNTAMHASVVAFLLQTNDLRVFNNTDDIKVIDIGQR